MSTSTAEQIDVAGVDWPEPVEIAAERVIAGTPAASTLVLEDAASHQLGLWRVSSGEFHTDHAGCLEYIHIVRGLGQLIDQTGVVTELSPGKTVLMQPGWKGRWVVKESITKVYTIINMP
jgi:uncharacterized cupin superfamily protein